jgi:SAM-dependent methyltransferase
MPPIWVIGLWLFAVGLAARSLVLRRRRRRHEFALKSARTLSGPEQNQFRFAAQSLETAKAIILTPEVGVSTDQRWKNETQGVKEILLPIVPSGATVLDFGTGIGRNLKALGDERQDIRLIGVNASPAMRRLAVEYVGQPDRLTLLSDLATVPTASVDLVVSTFVLQHVSGHVLEGVIQDIHRVLKPRGKLFIIDCRYRLVPQITELERSAQAAGGLQVDDAIHKVAHSELGRESAWNGDGLSVMKLLTRQFGIKPVTIRPDPARFGRMTRRDSHFAFFEKAG